ncbi:hypothetical protein ENUP19_0194G0026 [Entamoeba nuttalli]|uniref:Uncharacterized protein n=1 Tax=Entamoeba nuttalli TaxID=412467 RepID=A0ABQ0DNF5_9EUKA
MSTKIGGVKSVKNIHIQRKKSSKPHRKAKQTVEHIHHAISDTKNHSVEDKLFTPITINSMFVIGNQVDSASSTAYYETRFSNAYVVILNDCVARIVNDYRPERTSNESLIHSQLAAFKSMCLAIMRQGYLGAYAVPVMSFVQQSLVTVVLLSSWIAIPEYYQSVLKVCAVPFQTPLDCTAPMWKNFLMEFGHLLFTLAATEATEASIADEIRLKGSQYKFDNLRNSLTSLFNLISSGYREITITNESLSVNIGQNKSITFKIPTVTFSYTNNYDIKVVEPTLYTRSPRTAVLPGIKLGTMRLPVGWDTVPQTTQALLLKFCTLSDYQRDLYKVTYQMPNPNILELEGLHEAFHQAQPSTNPASVEDDSMIEEVPNDIVKLPIEELVSVMNEKYQQIKPIKTNKKRLPAQTRKSNLSNPKLRKDFMDQTHNSLSNLN